MSKFEFFLGSNTIVAPTSCHLQADLWTIFELFTVIRAYAGVREKTWCDSVPEFLVHDRDSFHRNAWLASRILIRLDKIVWHGTHEAAVTFLSHYQETRKRFPIFSMLACLCMAESARIQTVNFKLWIQTSNFQIQSLTARKCRKTKSLEQFFKPFAHHWKAKKSEIKRNWKNSHRIRLVENYYDFENFFGDQNSPIYRWNAFLSFLRQSIRLMGDAVLARLVRTYGSMNRTFQDLLPTC